MKEQFLVNIKKLVPDIFGDMEVLLATFKRDTYKESFQSFLHKYQEAFAELETMTVEDVEDQDYLKQVGELLADYVWEQGNACKSKAKRDKYQLDANLFMVSYFLPAILEIAPGRVGKTLTEGICTVWSTRFDHANIQAASYGEIDAGFKRKLCYITTAVCTALGLPEDCEELTLLKSYRDEVLMVSEDGQALVAQYYDIAPTIVNRIAARNDAKEIYCDLYHSYIKPCIDALHERNEESCLARYQEMVKQLKNRFMNGSGEV